MGFFLEVLKIFFLYQMEISRLIRCILSLVSYSSFPWNICYSPNKANSHLSGLWLIGWLVGWLVTEPKKERKKKKSTVHWLCLCISALSPSFQGPNTFTTSYCLLHGLCFSCSMWVVYVFIFFPQCQEQEMVSKAGLQCCCPLWKTKPLNLPNGDSN